MLDLFIIVISFVEVLKAIFLSRMNSGTLAKILRIPIDFFLGIEIEYILEKYSRLGLFDFCIYFFRMA